MNNCQCIFMTCLEYFTLLTSSSSLEIFPFIVSLMLLFLLFLLRLRELPPSPLCRVLYLLVHLWTLLSSACHLSGTPSSPTPCTPYTFIHSWKICFWPRSFYRSPDLFIQQPRKHHSFDFPHIPKLCITVSPPHLLPMCTLS